MQSIVERVKTLAGNVFGVQEAVSFSCGGTFRCVLITPNGEVTVPRQLGDVGYVSLSVTYELPNGGIAISSNFSPRQGHLPPLGSLFFDAYHPTAEAIAAARNFASQISNEYGGLEVFIVRSPKRVLTLITGMTAGVGQYNRLEEAVQRLQALSNA